MSHVGYQVTALAMPLIAVEVLDAGEFEVGLLTTFSTVAFLFVGLPAGALVDRVRRRSVLVVGDVGRAVALASIPLAWWAGVLTIGQLYVVTLVIGVLTVFFDVAYQSYLPHLVGRTHLVEGNAKLESVRAVAQVGAPGLGGGLIHLLTAPVAVLVDAVGLATSAFFVVRIRAREEKPERRPDVRLLGEITTGLRFVLGQPLLRAIAACTGSFNLAGSATSAMTVYFLRRDLGMDAGLIGVFLSAAGVGAVLGGLVARRVAEWLGQGPAIWVSAAATAPFGLLLPFAEPGWRTWLAAAGSVVLGAGIVVYNVSTVSFRQGLTPDHLLGRMNATMRFLVWGTMPVGGLLGAVLGEWLGARTTLLVAAVGSCLAFLPVFLSPLRTMRELPTWTAGDVPEAEH